MPGFWKQIVVCALGWLSAAGGVLAQPCAPLPTGVFAEWSACNNGPRVNWLVPSGQLIFPMLYRSLTTNFADAVQVASPGLNAASATDDAAPANVPLYYWVRFQGLNASCQFSAVAGPVMAQRVSLGGTTFVMPPPTATVTCDGVTVSWPRVRENLNGGVLLRRISGNPNTQVDFPLPVNATSFHDTSGTPGVRYGYFVFFLNTCRGTEGTELTPLVRFPPFADQAHASGAVATAGTLATISVDFGAVSPPVDTVNWLRWPDMTPVPTSQRVVASGRSLSFNPVLESDAGLYVAVPTINCVAPQSTQVGLVVHKQCVADVNSSGSVSVQDVFDFLTAFFGTCP